MFKSLKDRGLHEVQLVISDDRKDLGNGIKRNGQGVAWQRCQVHYTRNRLPESYLALRPKYGYKLLYTRRHSGGSHK